MKRGLFLIAALLLAIGTIGTASPLAAQSSRVQFAPALPLDHLSPITRPDADWLVALSTVEHFNAAGQASHLTAFTFSPDNRLLAIQTPDDLQLWELGSATLISTLPAPFPVVVGRYSAAARLLFSPAGRYVVSWHPRYQPTLRVWEVATGREVTPPALQSALPVYLGGRGHVREAGFSMAEGALLTLNREGYVQRWDLSTGALLAESSLCPLPENLPNAAAFSPDGRWLACAFDLSLIVWDLAGGTAQTKITLTAPLTLLAFSPQGRYLVYAGADVRMLEIETNGGGANVPVAYPEAVAINEEAVVVTSRRLTPTVQSQIELWDGGSSALLKTFTTEEWTMALSFSPNNHLLAVGNWQGQTRLYATPLCAVMGIGTVNLRAGAGLNFAVQASLPNGQAAVAIAQASDGRFRWWSLTGNLWVREDVVEESGDCASLPVN